MELPTNFWDNFLAETYDLFYMIWDTGHDLWLVFTRPISETYLALNGGVVDEFTEQILEAIGHFTPIFFMIGGGIAIVIIRFLLKLFLP